MSNRILLAVRESFERDPSGCLDIQQAKLDAQELIKQAKNDLIDEILAKRAIVSFWDVVKVEDIEKMREV